MSLFHKNTLLGASGAGGAGEALYVDDVFSTFLYEGTGSAQTITNGIDLDGEGGLVWTKSRSAEGQHYLFDTERGATKYIRSNEANAEVTDSNSLTAFNSDGFTIGSASNVNPNNVDLVSFSFRKAPGFFDVVTYTGNSTAGRTIAHNLGSAPGMIIIKSYSGTAPTQQWFVYHRSLGAGKYVRLNRTFGPSTTSTFMNDTEPTSSVFSLGGTNSTNGTGINYVAYVFAHDDQSFGDDSDEAIIKCGSFTGANYTESLGFEPQLLLLKRTDSSANWHLINHMSGFFPSSVGDSNRVRPDTITDESTSPFHLTSDGFYYSSSSATYIYVAIRRPHKPPTAGTDVFDDVAYTGNSSTQDISISPSIADSVLIKRRTAGDNWGWANRLTGSLKHLTPNSTAAEATRAAGDAVEFDRQSAFGLVGNSSGEVNYSGETLISYSFKRAPGFFDVVAYTGDGASSRNVTHNLGSAPHLVIVKRRNTSGNWTVWSEDLSNDYILQLNGTDAEISVGTGYINSSTSTTFNIGNDSDVNASGSTYIAYLFDTLAGISKVGTYSGSNSDVNVDCGFSAGARFVLIRRIDSAGAWYVFDTARGIVAGNDPFLLLNSSSAENTFNDLIDPLSSGFTLPGGNPDVNTSGGTYIFLAIA